MSLGTNLVHENSHYDSNYTNSTYEHDILSPINEFDSIEQVKDFSLVREFLKDSCVKYPYDLSSFYSADTPNTIIEEINSESITKVINNIIEQRKNVNDKKRDLISKEYSYYFNYLVFINEREFFNYYNNFVKTENSENSMNINVFENFVKYDIMYLIYKIKNSFMDSIEYNILFKTPVRKASIGKVYTGIKPKNSEKNLTTQTKTLTVTKTFNNKNDENSDSIDRISLLFKYKTVCHDSTTPYIRMACLCDEKGETVYRNHLIEHGYVYNLNVELKVEFD